MRILVSGATKTVARMEGHPNLGVLITPHTGNRPPVNMPWAADNAAYSDWNPAKFVSMLESFAGIKNRPMWVAAPDIVGDAISTAKKFKQWLPVIKKFGFKSALVLQNGQAGIGWGMHEKNFDAIFIGGDDEFKMGGYVRYAVGKAREMGKEVHMGRVNSFSRIDYARSIGCTSIDGTSCSMFPDTYIPKFLRHLETEQLDMGFGFQNKTQKFIYDFKSIP